MSTNIHKVNDIVLLTEDFQLQEDTTKVVKLDEEIFGFVFYLSGMISVDVTQNKKKAHYNRTTVQLQSDRSNSKLNIGRSHLQAIYKDLTSTERRIKFTVRITSFG